MHVNLEHAEKASEAARKKATELNTQMCIAIVDSGANLKAFMRMDDAWVGSIDIAIKKAKTACAGPLICARTALRGRIDHLLQPLLVAEPSGLVTRRGRRGRALRRCRRWLR